MPEPIQEQIVAAIETRLDSLVTAYRTRKVSTQQPKDGEVSIKQLGKVKVPELSHAGNPPAQAWEMEVLVACIVKPSDLETTAIDTLKNRFEAQVIEQLTSVTNWHNWGGLAINTEIGAVDDYSDSDGGFSGAQIILAILFRTSENDPYTARA